MAHKRRQFREIEVIETLVMQGAVIPCYRCHTAFSIADVAAGAIEKEHLHEVALGGADEPSNCRFSHKAPCHHTITNGSPATTAGSSKNRIAKATQPARIAKFQVVKRALDVDAVSEPTQRCRRCGEYPDACGCETQKARRAGGRR